MIILSCNNVNLSFGIKKILGNIALHIQDTDKVGLVGVNGAGKSTLFKIIAGILAPDSGEVFLAKNYKIGYLEQNTGLQTSNTIWCEMVSVYAELISMEKHMKSLESEISGEKDETRLASLVREYTSITDRYAGLGGYEYNSRIKGVLKGLGFGENDFDRTIESLSGGQKTRLALARLLLEEPDLLLLDEPTNHLDIESIEWLEDFLKNYRHSVIVISHDRYFLDTVTNRTIELENNTCNSYNGNYTSFVRQKAADHDAQQKHYELQQKEIAKMEAFIEQQKRWNREKNIVAAESRQKAIDRMEKIERPADLPGKIRIKFRSSIISGNDVLFVENLSKSYPGKQLFENINFKLKKNERVFLLGPNGCGKSTLLKILINAVDKDSGCVEYGHNVEVGYYDQEHRDLKDGNTVLEEVWNSNEKLTQTEIRTALASFLFTGEDVFKPISILSGGEKSRVSLLKLMLSGANFLLLDEPTNHLDINSREVLEESLMNYDGTLLVVSHDRYLINKLSTRILEMGTQVFTDFDGNYTSYAEYKDRQKKAAASQPAESRMTASKAVHIADKEERARQRKLEKQFNDTEGEILQIEGRLAEIENEMASDEIASDHIKLSQLAEEQTGLQSRLEELYTLWEQLGEEKESM